MKKLLLTITAIILLTVSCSKKREGDPKILVFSKTMGFAHKSIPDGITALQKMGAKNNFKVDTTTQATLFTDENLKQYSAIVFLSTTNNVLDHKQEAAFERYIQAGGGFVGIHAATDTEYDWGWYTKLVGGQFLSHPRGTPEADFIVKDTQHPATNFFTDSIWRRKDEMYNFKNLNPEVNVLLTIDESTYEGGKNGDHHPMAWYHEFDGGRAFYTAGGHTSESFKEEFFLKHLLGGITYAIGDNLELDYSKVTTQIPPDTDRFSKVPLAVGRFYEPTEMTILPNNDVLIAQRRGEILWYNAETKAVKQVALLDVYHKALEARGVNAEEGLMGLQKDPNYEENHWVYVFYSPTGDEWVNRLSRFKFIEGEFKMETEQVILDVESQREICCHTGGSIAFGPDNLLYLSTGDNSTPFNEKGVEYTNNGFAPLNDLPGKEQYDARRSSGNTNDLRGKILRIKVNEDGTYSIPKGNLFPEGTDKTRPEIYTMGHRNPYRISVDPKKGYVYWGDVGPDAPKDNFKNRGPRGYDELNQARAPGNFGWPLFVGNNYAYFDYDYATGESGPQFDPKNPINDSKNNTGLRELPPAQPAYVYYPYAETRQFPQVAQGGRNAMAGPTFYSDLYENGGGLPTYYNGKVIVYDWIRGWMKAVTLFEDGSFNKMEPFAPEVEINSLIDMELGPDGRLYLLEYGKGWFTANPDSGLSYIEFNPGNREPVLEEFTINTDAGAVPFTLEANAKAYDREEDALTYLWKFGNGTEKETPEANISYTYENAGVYKLHLVVKDAEGKEVRSTDKTIVVGNQRPKVWIELTDGTTETYQPGKPIAYKVTVDDPDGEVKPENVYVSVDYQQGMDKVDMNYGHQQVSGEVTGKALTQSLDCKSCHKEKESSIGPSYQDISIKYAKQRGSTNYLMTKIIGGGSGVWGEVQMPAHPDVSQLEARQIASYIESLTVDKTKKESLPLTGKVVPEDRAKTGVFILSASYTDDGKENTLPLTATNAVVLRKKE
ncbi:ThuA domain-containing protein [Croceivirga sp. JEA036]|uniref:ThuA domain-containing protein n=1 Tax=Croceivirga sp. JEA036 TaxID=2721162 RepID=UPI001439A7D2|nr:ThuA domain-containing protein [Croceivirga sp. JEA036]NJB37759.1 PKD domain-containing protein [Croceivirga sp. JEA036]